MAKNRAQTQAEHLGMRLDKVLLQLFPGWSRRELKRQLREGRVLVDQKRMKAHEAVPQAGLWVELCPEDENDPGLSPPPLTLLHASTAYVYIAKPSGVHSTMRFPGQSSALAFAVAQRWPECALASPDPRESGAIHRLDHETSGVLAFARTPEAWHAGRDAMSEAISNPKAIGPKAQGTPECGIKKIYLAVTDADPEQQDPRLQQSTLTVPSPDSSNQPFLESLVLPELPQEFTDWKPAPHRNFIELQAYLGYGEQRERVALKQAVGRHRTQPQSHPTLTHASLLATDPQRPSRSLWWLQLHRGFRHQLRVVLKALGQPIAGDPLYQSKVQAPRLLLHAYQLKLSVLDPLSPTVTAPIPASFVEGAKR